VMYLNDSNAPAFRGNPLGTAISAVCAVVLVAMFVGFNPLTNLTTAYSDLHPAVTSTPRRAETPAARVVEPAAEPAAAVRAAAE